jgi:peptide/nickel transport system ATP-binding protein
MALLTPAPVLEVNNLTVEFTTERGTVKAVDNVSFKLRKGETIGIVGESGSGKSVTSLSIMRLINEPPGRITQGEIILHSQEFGKIDLTRQSSREMDKIRGNEIAMIFQEPMTSLNPVLTCGDQVMEAILLHQNVNKIVAKKRTLELFEQVRLPRVDAIFKSYPHEISGGQKQRVMIAMALSCNPAVLIADEPTTALDVTVQSTILDLLENICQERGTSIIFITHDLGVIAEIADSVMVMYKGKVVEQGDVWDIFADPKHPYTKGLLACRPRLDIKMQVLPTVADFMSVDEEGKMSERMDETGKYASVGEALLLNFVDEEEIMEHQQKLLLQKPLLQVQNLQTYFPTKKTLFGKTTEWVKAVDDVSFEVFPGETLGLVGESGCGKTTLGRSILRLVEPTSGKVIFDGTDIRSYKKEELRKLRADVQIIFQDPYSSLNPRITIGEAIMEPMQIHGVLKNDKERRERVIELLETVSLKAEHFQRYPFEFSGGQRQRICIARTLALQPRFVICDESVSALDVSVQAQVLNLLNDLKQKFNLTYVFISHDLSVVKFMADRMIVMSKGKIEEIGFADKVYEKPQMPYTQTLISSIPKGDLEDIRKAQIQRRETRERLAAEAQKKQR